METRYTVRQAVDATGVKSYVLRYWEDELGLSIHRNELGHRYYTGYDIQLFRNIRELKRKGLQLRAIRNMIPQMDVSEPISCKELFSPVRVQEEGVMSPGTEDGRVWTEEKSAEEAEKAFGSSGAAGNPETNAKTNPESVLGSGAESAPRAEAGSKMETVSVKDAEKNAGTNAGSGLRSDVGSRIETTSGKNTGKNTEKNAGSGLRSDVGSRIETTSGKNTGKNAESNEGSSLRNEAGSRIETVSRKNTESDAGSNAGSGTRSDVGSKIENASENSTGKKAESNEESGLRSDVGSKIENASENSAGKNAETNAGNSSESDIENKIKNRKDREIYKKDRTGKGEETVQEKGRRDFSGGSAGNPEKILEFQAILERLIVQELRSKNEEEERCRSLDLAIRRQQLARREAAAASEKRSRWRG